MINQAVNSASDSIINTFPETEIIIAFCPLSHRSRLIQSNLAISHIPNGAIIINVDVKSTKQHNPVSKCTPSDPVQAIKGIVHDHIPLRLMVHRLHIIRLQHTVRFRQILLCE